MRLMHREELPEEQGQDCEAVRGLEGYWSNSLMNGAVINPEGVCRMVVCGAHCGCSPVIMEVMKWTKSSQ